MRFRKQQGFTLVEGLLTLFLVGIALSVVGSLVSSATTISRRADRLSRTTQAATVLENVGFEAHRALALVGLTTGVEDNQLVLDIRLVQDPAFLPDTPPGGWSVDAASLRKRVTISVVSGELVRRSDFSDGSSQTDILGEADGFFALLQADGSLRLRMLVGDDEVQREVHPCLIQSTAAPL